jgi:hypothetical protein
MHSQPLLKEFRSMMPDDLKETITHFIDHGVKYLIVGGCAFGVHAEPRRNQCFAYHILFGQGRGFCAVLKDVLRQMKL